MGRAGHQVAEMVRDHEGHLAMGEHGGLRAPGRAGGEEEPARIVVLHARHGNGLGHVVLHKRVVVFAETRAPDGDHEADRRCCLPHGRGVLGKVAVADHAGCAARLRQIGDLVRRLAEVRRHPDGAEPEAGEHRFEHLVAVLGLHQHAVSLSDPLCGKRCRHRIDAPVEIRPCPAALAPDEADLVRMPARRLPQEMRQVHHPVRFAPDAAGRRGGAVGHVLRSRIAIVKGTSCGACLRCAPLRPSCAGRVRAAARRSCEYRSPRC